MILHAFRLVVLLLILPTKATAVGPDATVAKGPTLRTSAEM